MAIIKPVQSIISPSTSPPVPISPESRQIRFCAAVPSGSSTLCPDSQKELPLVFAVSLWAVDQLFRQHPWSPVCSVSPAPTVPCNAITIDCWFTHFLSPLTRPKDHEGCRLYALRHLGIQTLLIVTGRRIWWLFVGTNEEVSDSLWDLADSHLSGYYI